MNYVIPPEELPYLPVSFYIVVVEEVHKSSACVKLQIPNKILAKV